MNYIRLKKGFDFMMIISADEQEDKYSPIEYLPIRIRRYFYGVDNSDFREIRLRCGRAVSIMTGKGIKYISRTGRLSSSPKNSVTATMEDMEDAVDILTLSSVYSAQEDMKRGFITARGGHRVGICGTMTPDKGYITDVSGLNYRFAREIMGAADNALSAVYNGGNIKNTLIVSPPGCGKTTFLRDLIRQISNLNVNVSVCDERGELAAVSSGVPVFDLGANTDVFDMCEKSTGMKTMIRTMSPRVIAADEIGTEQDIDAIRFAARSGVAVFATIHGGDWKCDVPKEILSCFTCVIQLTDKPSPGTVKEIVHV